MNKSSVITIDCEYGGPEMAAAYLIVEGDEAVFIDNNTARAVPILLKELADAGMTPDQVAYLIVTHVHLDHAGGTSELLKACPNARVLCQSNAQRHIVNPSRLVESAKQVYGEPAFTQLYGTIEPITSGRVRVMEHGSGLEIGSRAFLFIDTPGHARHHLTVIDQSDQSAYTGDAFGLHYPSMQRGQKPFVIASTPPTDFDPDQSRESAQAILEAGPKRIYVTHFGVIDDLHGAAGALMRSIDGMAAVLERAAGSDLDGDALATFCQDGVRAHLVEHAEWCDVTLDKREWAVLEKDILINAQGLAFRAKRLRRDAKTG